MQENSLTCISAPIISADTNAHRKPESHSAIKTMRSPRGRYLGNRRRGEARSETSGHGDEENGQVETEPLADERESMKRHVDVKK